MPDLPGSLCLTSTLPVRRPRGRAGNAAGADARAPRARAAGWCWSAASRARARAGSCASSPPRPPTDGALVLSGACDAVVRTPVRAVRRGARPARAAHRRRTSCGRRSAPAAASSRACCPTCRPGSASCRLRSTADPDTERHRLHTAVTDLLAGISGRRPVLLVLEDGHWADAPTLLLLRHLARAPGSARAAAARHLPRHRGRRARGALGDARRPAPLRRRRPAAARRPLRRRGGGVRPPRRRRRSRRRAAELATTISDLTDGNAFLVCELWRALVETGAVEVVDGTIRLDAAAGRARHARERPRGRQPAALPPGARDHRPARARGDGRVGVRARHRPPARRASASPSCSPPSTRPCAAG